MIPYATRTHPGLHREANEDSYTVDEELGLWIVADGLGGHSDGEVASALACDVICRDIRDGASLQSAIAHAHRAVLEEIERQGARQSQDRDASANLDPSDKDTRSEENSGAMGTTVVVLRVIDSHYEIAWVGDSRAYLFDGHLRRLTADHSAVNELLEKGVIDARKAANHPQRHALSRSLGVSERNTSAAEVVSGKLKPGHQILLCSDGLTDELDDAEILGALRINETPDAQAEALQRAALESGGRDNITLLIVGAPASRREHKHKESSSLDTTQDVSGHAAGAAQRRPSSRMGFVLLTLTLILTAAAVAALNHLL
ncbi:MAG: protein phosphatase 2C domain-containing protein [Pseudomonadota bacterium]